jgi:hypothetical protein
VGNSRPRCGTPRRCFKAGKSAPRRYYWNHLWNTVYLDHAVSELRAAGYPVLDADLERLSPYMRRHINFHGHYFFNRPDLPGGRRALRDPDTPGDDSD